MRKRWKKLAEQFWQLTGDTLIFVSSKISERMVGMSLVLIGMLLIGVWTNYWWSKNELARANQQAKLIEQLTAPAVNDLPHPSRIFIKWFVDAPIIDGIVEGNNWTLSDKEAIYISQSARPGQSGNIIIYGHNTRQILGNIRALRGGETVTLTLEDGSTRDYRVVEMKQIKPDDVSVIQPTDYEVLTLYTCSGFADKNRFVVRAVPID